MHGGARVIAAGGNQVLRKTFIHHTSSNLTGATAEYALILPDNEVVTLGLESTFAVIRGSIRKGLTDIVRKTVTLHAE